MLQELAAQSGSAAWAIGAMLFFLAAWVAVIVWVVRRRPEEMKDRARLPFDAEEAARIQESGVGTQESEGVKEPGSGNARPPNPES
jgi:hypothetical protein